MLYFSSHTTTVNFFFALPPFSGGGRLFKQATIFNLLLNPADWWVNMTLKKSIHWTSRAILQSVCVEQEMSFEKKKRNCCLLSVPFLSKFSCDAYLSTLFHYTHREFLPSQSEWNKKYSSPRTNQWWGMMSGAETRHFNIYRLKREDVQS